MQHGNIGLSVRSRRLLGAVIVFGVFTNLLMLTGPLYMLQVYDRVLGSASVETLVSMTLVMVFLYAMMAAIDWSRSRVMALIAAEWRRSIEPAAFDVDMTPGHPAGHSRALDHVASLHNTMMSPAAFAVLDLPWSPLFFGLLFLFHPMLGWLAIAGATLLILLTCTAHLLASTSSKQGALADNRASRIAAHAQMASNTRYAPGLLPNLRERWTAARFDAAKHRWQASAAGLGLAFLSRALRLMLQSTMLGMGAWLALRGEVTPGAMIAGTILSGRALGPLDHLTGNWTLLQQARLSWRSLQRIMPNDEVRKQGGTPEQPKAQLKLMNLTVRPPGAERPAVLGVNVGLEGGQVLGVIGPSGAGKTVLGQGLVGALPPTAGRVLLGDTPLSQFCPNALGRHVGYLSQNPQLWDGTVADNIASFAVEVARERIVAAATMAGADNMIQSLPNGYDTYISPGAGLSGGQVQRIALVRALINEPVLLVLDEPLTNLDHDGVCAFNDAIHTMKAAGSIIVILAQRPATIDQCDRLLVLSHGRPVEYGSRDDVLRRMISTASSPITQVPQRVRAAI